MNSKFLFGLMASGMLMATLTQSCVSDEPFSTVGDGEVRLRMQINSDVTRALVDDEALRSNCVVYISGSKGLLYKYQGLENLPASIPMKGGNYVAEAWTGDSVPASFDKRFFRGYQPFTVTTGVNSVVLTCKIRNSVVSLNTSSVKPELMKDWKITVANRGGELVFDESNMDYAKGYFMQSSRDTELTYKVEGVNAEGKAFTHSGAIANPRPAYEYRLNLEYNPDYEELGGAFVSIRVDASEVEVNSQVELYSAPQIQGADGYDADSQIAFDKGAFPDRALKIYAFGTVAGLSLSTPDYAALNLPSDEIDLISMTDAVSQAVKDAGITWESTRFDDKNMTRGYLRFSSAFLNAIPERDTEYRILVGVTDSYGKRSEATVRIAVGENAVVIDDPVTINEATASSLLNVRSTSAVLSGKVMLADAANPGISYRVADGVSGWTFVAAPASARPAPVRNLRKAKGADFNVTVTGLRPGTLYEFKAVADGYESESKFFTTGTIFTIPNAGMEEWHAFVDNSKILIPSADGQRTFWDSGNHGSVTMNKTLTQSSTALFHSGSCSAELKSQFVGLGSIGKFAAGNLFTGEYKETNMTTFNGKLSFGRPYDGSYPEKLVVWANYRPGSVQKKGAVSGYLNVGDADLGSIYVALTTQAVSVETGAGADKLFNPKGSYVVAYGAVDLTKAFGADGQLERLEIPLEYTARAATEKPTHIIIVCSASKYGDYFCGGEGSLLYVDDFELAY